MEYTHYIYDDILMISVKGDLLGGSDEMDLLKLVENYSSMEITNCILDIEGVKHMNSTGLSYLIRMHNKFNEIEGNFVIAHPSYHVQKLFSITKLKLICNIAESKELAFEFIHSKNKKD